MSDGNYKGLSREELEKAAGLDQLNTATTAKPKSLTPEELRKAAGLDELKPGAAAAVTQPADPDRSLSAPKMPEPASVSALKMPAYSPGSAPKLPEEIRPRNSNTPPIIGTASDGTGISSATLSANSAAASISPAAHAGSTGVGATPFTSNAARNTSGSSNDRKSQLKINKTPAFFDYIPFLGVLYRAVVDLRIGVLLWIAANMFVICGVCVFLLDGDKYGILYGVIIYLFSMFLVTSPAGERMLRKQADCYRLMDPLILKRLQPIFDRVYNQARELSPQISRHISLYISDDTFPNAFACGRRTICITRGLLDLTDEQLEGILAHEFGHLAARDTDESLVIVVGNVFVATILTVIGTCVYFICKIVSGKDGGDGFEKLGFLLKLFIAGTLVYLWTRLGMLFSMRSSRKEEYRADHYSWVLGKEEGLISGLAAIDHGGAPSGVWKSLMSSHPDTADRIMRLRSYSQEMT